MSSLAGKLVWITGAGSGIGRACAAAFAGAGARVALTGRRLDALEETASLLPASAAPILAPADLSSRAGVESAHRAVVAEGGDPHVLVNNAGWNIGRRHWRDLKVEDMAGVIDVDLKAPFALSIAVLPAMRRKREGTLIHISSLGGFGRELRIGVATSPGRIATERMP